MATITTVRDEVREFSPYVPGLSIDEIKQRYGLAQVIKMASNENPLGASPLVQRAIADKAGLAFRYPQAGNPRLAAALSGFLGVPATRLVTGNGSDEIIDLILRVKARPGQDNVVAFRPCFSIYSLQAKLCGLELRQVPLRRDFSFDLEALAGACDERTAVVFLTNPDNPSGYCLPAREVAALARRLPPQALLVVDEAYADFADPEQDYTLLPDMLGLGNAAVLRTFSKLYGLAGLRLGYGVMPEWLADYLLRVKLPFSVNLLAEEAGIAALADTHFREQSLAAVRQGREMLARELSGLGFTVYPSMANFLMFEPTVPAGDLFSKLLEQGIIIRPLKSYGLPGHLRVSVGNAGENSAFIAAVRRIVHG